jgi:GrpB-like predicted nucleotidyltransferase (UPF0157 family)
MSRYVFKPYHSIFPELFEKEKYRLREILGDEVQIEHFGSTAVPGLGGKGIIDIAIPVESEKLQEISQKVRKAGYIHQPNDGNSHRIVHIIDLEDPIEGERRYHLHVVDTDSEQYINSILLRDFLRAHPAEREQYARIKEEAVNLNKTNKEEYLSYKGPVIMGILRKAKDVRL